MHVRRRPFACRRLSEQLKWCQWLLGKLQTEVEILSQFVLSWTLTPHPSPPLTPPSPWPSPGTRSFKTVNFLQILFFFSQYQSHTHTPPPHTPLWIFFDNSICFWHVVAGLLKQSLLVLCFYFLLLPGSALGTEPLCFFFVCLFLLLLISDPFGWVLRLWNRQETQIVWDYELNSRAGNRGAFSECVCFGVLFVCVCGCPWVSVHVLRHKHNQNLRFLWVCVPGTCSFTSCPLSLNTWSQSVKGETRTTDRGRGANVELWVSTHGDKATDVSDQYESTLSMKCCRWGNLPDYGLSFTLF